MKCLGCPGDVSDQAASIVEREQLSGAVHGRCLRTLDSPTHGVMVDGFSNPVTPEGGPVGS